MKILFVVEHFYPYIGGAEKLFYELAKTLASKGHQIWVVTTQHDEDLPLDETIKGITVKRIPCSNRFLFTFYSLATILQIAKDCDVLHTTTYNAALPTWLAGRLKGKRVIITFHEVWGSLWWRLPFLNFVQKLIYYTYEQLILKLSFYKYVAVSDFTKEALEDTGISPKRITRIYNGLETNEFKKFKHQKPEQFTYTFFGRLGVSKGLDLLLPAAKEFSLLYPESKLKLIIPMRPISMHLKIKKRIQDLGLEKNIQVMHELSKKDLYKEITNSSCIVIPSYSEGFCFVAAETVAMGVPIISSQKGALKEVVSGKYLEMESFDSKGLLAALVKAREGEWQEKSRKNFHLSETVNKYLDLYADC